MLLGYAWLSVAAAVATISIKALAYWLTDSVGLFSDALESGLNLLTAAMALALLRIAGRAPDREHNYGHEKAEYFSSGVEGTLILLAAASIVWVALQRLLEPQPIERLDLGIAFSLAAALINLLVARILLGAGRRHRSVALEADGHHLMSDVWTSLGVVAGLAGVAWTGRPWLDPLAALVVAAHIGWVGLRLVRRSVSGLMDKALTPGERRAIVAVLRRYAALGVRFHALRTRRAGQRSFISVHIMVPGQWSVQKGHDLLEEIEAQIRARIPAASIFTHLEPLEDPLSQADEPLDRP